jgi:hypothetical protein
MVVGEYDVSDAFAEAEVTETEEILSNTFYNKGELVKAI